MYHDYQRGYDPRTSPHAPNPSQFAHHLPPPPQRSPRLGLPSSFPSSPQYPQYQQAQYPGAHSPRQAPHSPTLSRPHFFPPTSHNPPPPPPSDAIKCSSCSAWVHLDNLGDHVCGSRPSAAGDGDFRGRQEEALTNGLRIDVQAAGPVSYSQNPSLRSPMYPNHLEPTPPHTPGSSLSRPTSPALSAHSDQVSRSVSSNSSASSSLASGGSSSRMPFFERYNKLVGSGNAGTNGGSNMAGVGMRNLDMAARSPRTEEFGGTVSPSQAPTPLQRNRSPSPNPTSFNRPHAAASPQLPLHRYDPPSQLATTPDLQQRPPNLRPQRSQTSFSPNDIREHQSQQPWQQSHAPSPRLHDEPPQRPPVPHRAATSPSPSPALVESALEPSPAAAFPAQITGLARSSSNSSSLHSIESAYIAYDRRDTLKPTPSNPAMTRSPSTKSNKIQGGGSISSLDALEDLLLMAREEAEDDPTNFDREDEKTGKQALLDEFLAPSKPRTRRNGTKESSDWYQDEDFSSTPRAPTRIPTSKSVPSLTPFSNSLSTSRNGSIAPSGSSPNLSSSLHGPPTSFDCTTCQKRLKPSQIQKAGDGQLFCRECYAERYLPKCRKCEKAIEGGAVTSSDGKVLGKYHPACFSCFSCSKSFPSGEFYVYDGKPYCQYDYHVLNASLCMNKSCGTPIEGPCVSLVGEENGGGGRYHPSCFACSIPTCAVPLLEHHFVVDRLPYCELHSSGSRHTMQNHGIGPGTGSSAPTSRAKKRQTVITKR